MKKVCKGKNSEKKNSEKNSEKKISDCGPPRLWPSPSVGPPHLWVLPICGPPRLNRRADRAMGGGGWRVFAKGGKMLSVIGGRGGTTFEEPPL